MMAETLQEEGVEGTDDRETMFKRYQHDPRILITFACMPEKLKEHFRQKRPDLTEEGFLYSYRCTCSSAVITFRTTFRCVRCATHLPASPV